MPADPPSAYTCRNCHLSFPTATDLITHMAERHPRQTSLLRRIKRWWRVKRGR